MQYITEEELKMENTMKKYKSIDGLKAVSIIMIVLVHVAVNGQYKIDNYFFNVIVKHLSIFIELFFMLSAFGMCCGYYEKFKNGEISLNDFYKRRIIRIWPCFALLVVLDLVVSGFIKKNILEAFLDGTLLMGFLPNNHIEIAGIGWTLGVIFAFYILFPFFVFIMWNKLRAWISLAVFVAIKLFATPYLAWEGKALNGNILTWFFMFIIGGLLFLYKDTLIKIFKRKEYLLVIIFALLFAIENYVYNKGHGLIAGKIVILSFIVLIIYAMVERVPILGNKVLVFIGTICLQIYLFHVMVFRVLEKIGSIHLVKNETISLIIVFLITLAVTIGISYVIKMVFDKLTEKLEKRN